MIIVQLDTEQLNSLIQNAVRKAISDTPKADPAEPQLEQEFSISGLAHYLNCTKTTIHAYKRRGVFPYYQTGRTVYFKKSEVDKALEVGNKKKGDKA